MPPAPVLEDTRIRFQLSDPHHRYTAVRLYQEIQRPRDGIEATFEDGLWTLWMPRPDGATRVEYAFIADHPDGGQDWLTDPDNPLVAEGPFGAKSVVQLPGYTAPAWLDTQLADGVGALSWAELPLPRFDTAIPCGIWQPTSIDSDQPLPLLIAHDGPEYAEYAGLLRVLGVAVEAGRIPPVRAALLGPVPGRRDETYSAAARYADGVAFTALPWLARTAPQPTGSLPIMMGASLGALAALHLTHRHPGRFGGLYLQSGSYFRLRTDGHERGFAHFDRISRFIGQVLADTRTARPLPITMTCGAVEENLANNRVMAKALRDAGHEVDLVVNPDGHTYTAWRDTLDPHLIDLLARAVPTAEGR